MASRRRAKRSLNLRPLHAGGRHFVQPFAGADAQDDAVREHRAERADGLRDD